MNKPNDWENVKAMSEREPLPAGAYVCKIEGAKIATYGKDGNTFDKLEIAIDITEGEHAGHYKRDFEAQKDENKKWKGVLRQYLPKEDGSEKDGWTKSSLKALIEAVEESNSGFHFDWDEKKLKGKVVGILFQNQEWSFGGKTGWKAQPFRAIKAQLVRDGKYRLPADKPLADSTSTPNTAKTATDNTDDDDDLPF
jgi:hypothetical protein